MHVQFEFLFVGIMFQDITPLFLNHKVFKDTVDIFVERYRDMAISVVAGFSPPLSYPFFALYKLSSSVLHLGWKCGICKLDFLVFEGIDARGFMFAPCIALAIGAKFVPLRKRGKLPGMYCIFPS